MRSLNEVVQTDGTEPTRFSRMPDPAGSLRDLLADYVSQDTRLLELHFSSDSGISESRLLAHRLTGYEAINEGFRFEVECLSPDAFMPLKELEGVPLQITLLADRGARRQINGVVTEALSEGSDGSLAVYRLILEPATAALKLGQASRVFLGQSYLQAALQILGEEIQDNPVFAACMSLDNRCRGECPAREFIFLCAENKWDFIKRCLARAGVSFVFAPAREGSPDFPQHTLILFDDPQDLDENEAGSVRFHRADGTEQRDAITQWHARRSLQCGKVTRRRWDHNSGSLCTATEALQSDQGRFGNALASTLEEYRHESPLEHDDIRTCEARTAACAKAREQRTKLFAGAGSVRDFRAGTCFSLTDHPVHDQDPAESREFVLTRVDLEARNNLPKGLEDGLKAIPGISGGTWRSDQVFRNRFECLRKGTPILSEELPAPAPGYLTGTVVGPGNEAVHTDELGRIKVRLHCTREEDHPEAGASGTDKDSFWIRQVQPWSSQGMGGNLIPRMGDEVLLAALANDPDKLVVIGVLPGGTRRPGRFSGVSELPADKAVSGFRSRSHEGLDGSQCLFDDTPSELRAQLASDHASSALNLGFITHPRAQGMAEPRGEGAELRTDGAASIRAARGLLLSAAAQIRANGPQLAREELAQLFETFRSLTEGLGDYAGRHQGLPPQTGPEKALEGHLKDWELGTSTRPRTQRPSGGQRLIALSAPDGLVSATPKTTVLYAGENLDLAAQQHAHVTVGQQLAVNAGKGLSLFSHSGGFRAIAHQDDMDIQAQHGDLVLTASKNVKVFASENEILIAAAKKLTLMCGGSYLTVAPEGILLGGPAFTGKVGRVSWPGTDTRSIDLPRVDMGRTRRKFQHYFEATGEPIPDASYRIRSADGRVFQGKTDRDGFTEPVELEDLQVLSVEFEDDQDE